MFNIHNVLFGFLLVMLPSVSVASKTPEQLIEKYFEYVVSNSTWRACDLYRQKDLSTLKKGMLPIFLAEEKDGKNEARTTFFGSGVSIDSVKGMEEMLFCERILQVATQETADPEALKMLKLAIIGKVMEGANTAHIVVRYYVELADIPLQNVEVETVFREGDVWKMTMPEAMSSLGGLFEAAVEPKE